MISSTYKPNAPRCATCKHNKMVHIMGEPGHGFVCTLSGTLEVDDTLIVDKQEYLDHRVSPSGVCDFYEVIKCQ